MNKWQNAARKRVAEIRVDESKAGDLDVIVAAMAQLPPGQLKKVLTEEIIAVLEKYGVTV